MSDGSAPVVDIAPPLVLDVDGSLLRTDLLFETFWAALGTRAGETLAVSARTFRKPAELKRALLGIATPDIDTLPIEDEVLTLAQQARAEGRRVILTSGADQSLVEALAARLDLPGPHYGSDGETNLTGSAKAKALLEAFGSGGFDYVGNSKVDLTVWQEARQVICVGPDARLATKVAALGKPTTTVGEHWTWKSLIKGMRPHQWLKNMLLLLPLLAAQAFSLETLFPVLLMIVAFSATASSVYLTNDLFDLATDRLHPEKRYRPTATGALPIQVAMVAAAVLAAVGLAIAFAVGWPTLGLLIVYVGLTLSYSMYLKQVKWVDMVVLASLYTLRVITGAAAAQIAMSGWLIAFSLALFFTLTAVKRLGGLSRAEAETKLPGRGYSGADRQAVLWTGYLGAATAGAVFLAYSMSPDAKALYSNLIALRLSGLAVLLWTLRLVRISRHGLGVYDPVVFVTKDKVGFLILLAAVGFWLWAL